MFKQPKCGIKMAAQSFLMRMLRRNWIFRDRTHPLDTDIWWWINFQVIQCQTRRNCHHNWLHWMGHAISNCTTTSFWNEIDTTVACQSSYTKVFASDGNFHDVCGKLIGVGQNRPLQRPLLSVCGERFRCPWLSKKCKSWRKSQN